MDVFSGNRYLAEESVVVELEIRVFVVEGY
jgi:hypothetical protein